MRGFTDDERERIREELLAAGRTLFAKYGLSKTTITDLTDEVGIGTSTFYQFFDSKEELYIAVLEDIGEDVYRRLEAQGIRELDDPEETIERLLRFILTEIETNPLTRQLIVNDELDRLREYQSEDEREAERQEDIAYIRAFTDPFFEEGRLHGEDPETIAAAITAIPYLTLHRDDIGEERYPAVRDYVIESFARGAVRDQD